MSEQTRTVSGTIKNILAKLLLGFLVITFAIWGIGDIAGTGSSQTVATVGDESISVQEFQNEWRFYQTQMRDQLPAELLTSPMFQQQVLERIVRRKLYLASGNEAGLHASEAIVADYVRNDPQFQDVRGKFDAETYERVLQALRMTEAQFLRTNADDLVLDIMNETFNLGGANPSDAWETIARMSAQETRSADVITITLDKKETIPTPPEQVLREAYARDVNRYMVPELRNFALATISPTTIEARAKAAITDEVITNHLASQGLEDSKPNRLQARKDLLPGHVEDEAYAISIALEDAVAGGASLNEAIEATKIDAKLNTFDGVSASALSDKFQKHAAYLRDGFSMAEGDVTNLLTTGDGTYFLLQVDAVIPEQPKPFEDVQDAVMKNVLAGERMRRVRQKAEELLVQLSGANGVDARNAVLKDHKLKRDVVTLRRGDAQDGKTPARMRAAIFGAQLDQVLGPFENAQSHAQQLAILTNVQLPMPDKVKQSLQTDNATIETFQELVNSALMQTMQAEHPVRMRMRLEGESAQ